jgi:hypothetical protein
MTVNETYMGNRRLRGPLSGRPQAMIWAELPPTVTEDGKLIPVGYEIGSDSTGISAEDFDQSFIILSDHNRAQIDIANERIEQRQRMANGTMRSFFIADKLTINTSWSMLPSRSSYLPGDYNQETGKPFYPTAEDIQRPYGESTETYYADKSLQFTADGGAGGVELLDWYENHKGPFWVLLSYDKYNNFADDSLQRIRTNEYAEVKQMYLSNFQYSVVKRGSHRFDLWDISITLEEV